MERLHDTVQRAGFLPEGGKVLDNVLQDRGSTGQVALVVCTHKLSILNFKNRVHVACLC